jgi:hypothetical protein
VDPIDETVLSALQDDKPGVFTQLLDRTAVSHNTLRLHLEKLLKQGLVSSEKTPSTGLGRPRALPCVFPANIEVQSFSVAVNSPSGRTLLLTYTSQINDSAAGLIAFNF